MSVSDAPAGEVTLEAALIERLAQPGPRYTSYPTAPMWSPTVDAAAYAALLGKLGTAGRTGALYVHLPFCRQLCHYCGCNVVITGRRERVDRYVDYLERELDLITRHAGCRPHISEVHFGGGTPTFLDLTQLERLWSILEAHLSIDHDELDASVEVDPRITTAEQLALLRRLGFSRLSMGIQDFSDEVQAAIGRHQTEKVAVDLFAAARSLGYRSINFDLVYGLPRQTAESFAATIARVIELRPDRIAIFSYAHLPALRPNQRAIDAEELPRPATKLHLFLRARSTLVAAGYQAMGIDHFAVPDDELAVAARQATLHRSFQGYTPRPVGDTLAIGVSAIGDVQNVYVQNHKRIAEYYASLDERRLPTERGCVLTQDDVTRRGVIHGILCNGTVDLARFGGSWDAELAQLDWAQREGLLVREGLRLTLTAKGQLFARNVAMAFDAYLQGGTDRPRPTFSSTV